MVKLSTIQSPKSIRKALSKLTSTPQKNAGQQASYSSLPSVDEVRKSFSKQTTSPNTLKSKKKKRAKASASKKSIARDPFKEVTRREKQRARNRDKRVEPGHSSTGVPLPTTQAMKEHMEAKRHRREVYYENKKNSEAKRGGKFYINTCMGGQNKKY